jgi:hypothetical protein
MGKEELRNRETWQDYSGVNAGGAEKRFYGAFSRHFQGSDFRIREKPAEFKDIYINVPLPQEVLDRIYQPDEPIIHHGIIPDYAIDNLVSKKTLYVEVKRQDGWVEGKPRSAGRGNAHERACKLFTPGLINILRAYGHIAEPALPFWVVFQGDIARDPCRVREIHCWFSDKQAHFFLWDDTKEDESVINHFNNNLYSLLL